MESMSVASGCSCIRRFIGFLILHIPIYIYIVIYILLLYLLFFATASLPF